MRDMKFDVVFPSKNYNYQDIRDLFESCPESSVPNVDAVIVGFRERPRRMVVNVNCSALNDCSVTTEIPLVYRVSGIYNMSPHVNILYRDAQEMYTIIRFMKDLGFNDVVTNGSKLYFTKKEEVKKPNPSLYRVHTDDVLSHLSDGTDLYILCKVKGINVPPHPDVEYYIKECDIHDTI